MKKGNTYLVRCTKTGIYKIGHSTNPKKRLSGLRVGNPFVELIGTTSTPEHKLHNKYEQYRVGGEWFEFPDEVTQKVIGEFYEWAVEPKTKQGHKKEQNQTADVLDFEFAKRRAEELLNDEKDNQPNIRLGMFIMLGIYTGIKPKQLMKLRFEDIRDMEHLRYSRTNDNELKQIIPIPSIIQYYLNLKFKNQTGYIFVTPKSRGGNIVSIQTINRALKVAFAGIVNDNNVSTHTLRKTYGRKIYEINDKSILALSKLQIMFNQSSIKSTKEYLHICDNPEEEINLIIEE